MRVFLDKGIFLFELPDSLQLTDFVRKESYSSIIFDDRLSYYMSER